MLSLTGNLKVNVSRKVMEGNFLFIPHHWYVSVHATSWNYMSEYVDITSDTTVSSEGLTSTTVSRTSLLWWRVLCPVGEDWKHVVNLSWIKHLDLGFNSIEAWRLDKVKLTNTVARRWAVWPRDILLMTSRPDPENLFESGRFTILHSALYVGQSLYRDRQPTCASTQEQKLE